jgi:EAL domain-containing protein (putative c-di-GMP-specific phosphodiesterase class I)
MEREVQRRTTIEQALREPELAAGIELLFQPIFELGSMELISFEALARWQHPKLGWISPAEFIPITEQVSILHEISDALLARAASVACGWPTSVRLCFNLSSVQLCSPATASNVLALIDQERLDPRRLEIEVTETALLADFDAARANLSALREKGVRIVLDDFGAGYSSIGYLRQIKFDTVKLDGSLISSMTDVDNGLPLLRGVLELCRATGHDCVAEHIETAQQLHLLRQLGCRYGQGFGLCEPVTRDVAAAMATSRRLPAGKTPMFNDDRHAATA